AEKFGSSLWTCLRKKPVHRLCKTGLKIMDQILLPLVHSPLSYDTVISPKTQLRLGTSLVMLTLSHAMTGHALAELPPGYSFQKAYLNIETPSYSPCPNRRTITQTYEYQLPTETEEYGTNPDMDIDQYNSSESANRFAVGSYNTFILKLF
ncbi:MAG TPA: hypothetical protein VFM18_13260, partial [Methanosarcina sp.]|nr:hypothetical protein [Methanosarcina sp.]